MDQIPKADTISAIVASLTALSWYYAYWNVVMPFTLIYTLTIAGLSILLALLCLTPFTRAFRNYTDCVLSALWIIAFGLLLRSSDSCSYALRSHSCSKMWKAATAFSCLSSLLWLTAAVFVSHA